MHGGNSDYLHVASLPKVAYRSYDAPLFMEWMDTGTQRIGYIYSF
jgi:hypothetical protein